MGWGWPLPGNLWLKVLLQPRLIDNFLSKQLCSFLLSGWDPFYPGKPSSCHWLHGWLGWGELGGGARHFLAASGSCASLSVRHAVHSAFSGKLSAGA